MIGIRMKTVSTVALAERDLELHGLAAPLDLDGDLIAGFLPRHLDAQVVAIPDDLTVELRHHIVGLETRLLRRGACVDTPNLAALDVLAVLVEFHPDIGVIAAANDIAGHELGPGLPVRVHRNVDIRDDGAANPAVDANHPALHVKERPTRVATHQRAISLNGHVAGLQDAAQAHHGRTPLLVAAGVAGGDAPLAFLQVSRLAQLDEGPFALLGDLDHATVDP